MPDQNNQLHQLHELGQSVWLDYIRRDILRNGDLQRMIAEHDLRGVTSNPSIFEQAIGKSDDYDSALEALTCASREGAPFAIAVIDHGSQGLDAVALLRAIDRQPALRALRTLVLSPGAVERETFWRSERRRMVARAMFWKCVVARSGRIRTRRATNPAVNSRSASWATSEVEPAASMA